MGRAFEYRRASKEARWDKMSKLFPKLAKAITVAAKEGGSDPDMNPKLRSAIATAKAQNMPKDNIDAAIKRASGKDSSDIKTIFYDGKAAHGVQIIVETATDNATRTVANVKAIFNKNGGEILPSGSLSFMFSRKAVFEVEMPSSDLEELELDLIDYGLELLEQSEDSL
jgi:YebC/PmpR family DNA-binding regulatory protein